MSARPKLPALAEVIALAEQNAVYVSINDLARMHRIGEFTDKVARELWPSATPRFLAGVTGQTRYEGVPCGHCGGTLRNVASRTCVPCHRERKRGNKSTSNWHAENREYLRNYLRAWRAKRKEQAA